MLLLLALSSSQASAASACPSPRNISVVAGGEYYEDYYVTGACSEFGLTGTLVAPLYGTLEDSMSTNAVRYRNTNLNATSDTFTIRDDMGQPIVYNVTITSAISITPASLPNATVAQAYSATSLNATGGAAPYTYAVTAGSLPAGMSLSPAGTLSGTPTAGGSFNFTVRATDALAVSGAHAYTMTVSAATITIAPTSLPAASVGVAYSQSPTASNGIAPYNYSISSGSLPAGLTLSPAGVLSGTPTAGGNFNFTVLATDSSTGSGPYSGARAYSLTVSAPTISVAPTTLPNPTVGVAYSQTFTSSGSTAPYTYAITSGSVPAGLSFAPNGTLSGTPTAAGTYNFTVTATDSSTGSGAPYTGSRAYSVTLAAGAAPVVSGVTPSYGPSTGGTYVTISGSNFTGVTAVRFGAMSATSITVYSATQIAAYSPAGMAGTVDVTVTTAGGTSATSAADQFTYVAAPAVTSVSPASGPSTGGTTVTINGTGLNGATAVTFGATAATGFTVNSPTQITATSPAGNGTVDIRVTTAGGTSATSAADQFTYAAAQQTQTITFGNPGAQNFGTTPTLTATSSSNLTPTFASSTTGVCTITLSGVLTFITAGSCTIDADQAGNATYAPASTVSQTFTVNAIVPGAPVVGVATAGDTQATVSFTAPASSGGAAIIANGYTVTASPGGATATGSSSPITVTGLTNGVPYTFTVTATNSAGTGNASAASNSVTPSTLAPLSSLSINDVSRAEGNAGTTAFIFNVTLTPASASTVTVNYATSDGSATAPSDYIAASGTLTFAPGQTTQTVTVQVNGDTTVEPDETFFVSLSNPVSAMIARAQGMGTIVNDDSASSVSAPNKTVSVAAGATALVDVTAGATGGPFTAAGVVSLAPANAGVADIVGGAGAYSVRFVPAASFAGVAVASYTLSNATTTSAPATVTITVGARADVAQDAEVAGLATAQASAAQRFTTAQVTNFTQRLESLHGGGWGRSSFGLSLATDDTRKMARSGNGNGVADQVINGNPLRNGMRTVGLKPQRVAQAQPAPASDLPDLPGATAEQARSPWAFWVNGAISYGRERSGDADDRYRFTTNGISAGVDYRVNSWITVGTGLGISTDRSRVGNKGTRSNADSTVAVAYASMRPMQGVFVDALLGYGVLSFDSKRYITATGDLATGSRDGKQLFGSIATGLEFYRTDWMWSPYARLEFSQAKLDAYTEDGPAMHALKYFDQTARSHKAVLGARAEGKVAVRWGHIMPQVRVEYARSFDEQNEAGLAYADLAAQGPAYTLRGRAMDTGRWTVGLGGRLVLRNGTEVGVEYTTNIDQSNAYVGSLRLGLRVPF